jgi:hypothetical protein
MCFGGGFLKAALPIGALIAAPFIAPEALGAIGADAATAGAADAASTAAGVGLGDIGSTGIAGLDAAQNGIGLGSMLTGAAGPSGMLDAAQAVLPEGISYSLTNPTFWAGQGLGAAGTMAKNAAYQQQLDYMNNAMATNQQANAQLGAQGRQIINGTVAGFAPDAQANSYSTAVGNRVATADNNLLNNQSVYLPQSNSAPQEVKDAMAQRLSDGLSYARSQAEAAATLGAAGDVNLKNSLALNDSATKLNQLNNFAQGNNQTLGTALATAPLQGRTASTIGDLLGAAGQMTNFYAVNQANKFSKNNGAVWGNSQSANSGASI